jgi:hypothetical protein
MATLATSSALHLAWVTSLSVFSLVPPPKERASLWMLVRRNVGQSADTVTPAGPISAKSVSDRAMTPALVTL